MGLFSNKEEEEKDETFAKFLKLAAAKLGFMEILEHDN